MPHPLRVIIDEDTRFASEYDIPGLTKGGAVSLLFHASIFLLAALVSHQQSKSKVMLTEITLVEQVIPIPEEEAPPPAPVAPPPEDRNVWDFLKQVIPLKQDEMASMASDMPEIPKQDKQELAAMPEALDLGAKKDLDKPAISDKPLDLVGRKAVAAPAGMDVNPLKMKRKSDALAATANLPKGINVGKKSSWLPSKQAPIVSASKFARRTSIKARGGALADMPTIKKKVAKKESPKFDTSNLNIQRRGSAFRIFGPLKDRAILKKYLPRYPRWAEEQGLEANVTLHFFVMPGGSVKGNLYVEQSSGYAEMDRLAMKALQAFQFAPIASGEEQEGVIIFYFRLR